MVTSRFFFFVDFKSGVVSAGIERLVAHGRVRTLAGLALMLWSVGAAEATEARPKR